MGKYASDGFTASKSLRAGATPVATANLEAKSPDAIKFAAVKAVFKFFEKEEMAIPVTWAPVDLKVPFLI